jgi:8-oxo-dGTP pyrophosphatase MutT (NUDIX family)
MTKPPFYKSRCYGGIIKSLSSGKYLLVKVFTGKWSFPKGHREENETPHECATREIYEETGLTIENIQSKKAIFVSLYYYFDIEFYNECPTNPIDTKEVKDIGWFTPEETLLLEKNKDVNIFFEKILKGPIEPIKRNKRRRNNKINKNREDISNPNPNPNYLCIIPESQELKSSIQKVIIDNRTNNNGVRLCTIPEVEENESAESAESVESVQNNSKVEIDKNPKINTTLLSENNT